MVRSGHLERQHQQRRRGQIADDLPTLASQPNVLYNERHMRIQTYGFLAERGIDTQGLESTTIPDTILARQWGRFTSTPPPYHADLVREFYAAMVPEVFKAEGSVWVRGVQVEITPTAINAFLDTPPYPPSEPYEGMPGDVIEGLDTPAISASLRRDGSDAWGIDDDHMNHGDLHADIAFWTVFIKCSLIPSAHRTQVSMDTAHILFAIQNYFMFDVGHIIFNQILRHGKDLRGLAVFPCLITHFCGLAGLNAAFDAGALQAPKSDICKKAYNYFCTHHGLPNLPTAGGRYRNRGRGAPAQQQGEAQHGVPGRYRAPRPPPPQEDAAPPPFHADPDIRERIEEIHSRVIHHGHILHRLQQTLVPPPPQPHQQTPANVYRRRPREDGSGPSSSHQH